MYSYLQIKGLYKLYNRHVEARSLNFLEILAWLCAEQLTDLFPFSVQRMPLKTETKQCVQTCWALMTF
jgi:hypothetical protein